MKFKVRKTESLKEPELEFWLEEEEEDGHDTIFLYVSSNQEKYNYIVLTINKDGIRTRTDFPARLGMPVDSLGRVGVNLRSKKRG